MNIIHINIGVQITTYSTLIYRVSKKKLTPFIFKLASNLLQEFDNSHVYSQQDVGN